MCNRCRVVKPFVDTMRKGIDTWHFVKTVKGLIGDSLTSPMETSVIVSDEGLATIDVMSQGAVVKVVDVPLNLAVSTFEQMVIAAAELPNFGDCCD